MSPETESEKWFERYLATAGYAWQYEPDLGVPTRPDYLVSSDAGQLVAEVKEFDAPPASSTRPGRAFVLSPKEEFGQVRRLIRRAAPQLKPLADRGWPLVAV